MPTFAVQPREIDALHQVNFWGMLMGYPADLRTSAIANLRAYSDQIGEDPTDEQLTVVVGANSDGNWLCPEVPLEWLAELLITVERFAGFRFLLMSPEPAVWQQRMRDLHLVASDLPSSVGRASFIARDWLDGRHPRVGLGFRGPQTPANLARSRIMHAIPAAYHLLAWEDNGSNPMSIPIAVELSSPV